jgi:hypothetical protein
MNCAIELGYCFTPGRIIIVFCQFNSDCFFSRTRTTVEFIHTRWIKTPVARLIRPEQYPSLVLPEGGRYGMASGIQYKEGPDPDFAVLQPRFVRPSIPRKGAKLTSSSENEGAWC